MMKIMVDIDLVYADEVISKDDEYDKESFFCPMYHVLLLFEFD